MIPHTCSDAADAAPGRSSPWPMVEVQVALGTVLQHAAPLAPVVAPLDSLSLLGRVLASPVMAPHPFPPFRTSTMDGYACHAADVPGTLPVRSEIRAGDAVTGPLVLGQCAYITTGAPVPDGADAVVMIESTEAVGTTHVRVLTSLAPGTNIRTVGCDVQQGERLAAANTVIGPSEVGLFASFGLTSIPVYGAPRVAVLSTGDELTDAYHSAPSLSLSRIRDSNRPMLLSMIKHFANTDATDLGIARDIDEDLVHRLTAARTTCDIVIASGGVSMGDRDRIKPVLEQLGAIHIGRVAMKPGKPLTFATLPRLTNSARPLLFFGLPGNPVSAFVTFLLFVLPAIRSMRGETIHANTHGMACVRAKVVGDWPRDRARTEYHRCLLAFDSKAQSLIALSTGGQLSSRLTSAAQANALAIIAPGSDRVSDGSAVEALLFDGLKAFSATELSVRIEQARHAPQAGSHLHHHHHHHHHHSTTTASRGVLAVPPVAAASAHHADAFASAPVKVRACVLTVSDRCSSGEVEDRSGPTLVAMLHSNDYGCATTVVMRACVPDEVTDIRQAVVAWTDSSDPPSLVLITGGTGLSPRDRTPEAIAPLLERHAPGLVHLMLSTSLAQSPLGPLTCLSRPVAGTRGSTLIVTMPGSESACKELWSALKPVMQHAIQILRGQ